MRSNRVKTNKELTNGLQNNINDDKNESRSDDKPSDESSTDPLINYTPKLFLRCHCKQNDPFDNSTNIWSAAFQPQTNDESDGNRFVATLGANMVCIIDCEKCGESSDKSVIARYIDPNPEEEFTSLAWSVIDVIPNETLILAVGGQKNILLMSDMKGFHCFERIKSAHSDQINALLFASSDLLFSASYDKSIKLWRISRPDDKSSTQVLKTIETKDNLLSLCYSHKYNTLIASGYKGLYFLGKALDLTVCDKNAILSHMKTKYLIDGLQAIPEDEDVIAIRINLSKIITIIDLKKAILESDESDNNCEIKSILLSKVMKARLRSFDFESPFIYLTAQKNLLFSGGPNGQIWVYRTDRFTEYYDSNEMVCPDRVLEWPLIENIVKDNKTIIDDKKPVIVNTVAVSPDLQYLIGCTQMNVLCIWHKS